MLKSRQLGVAILALFSLLALARRVCPRRLPSLKAAVYYRLLAAPS
jgi:hypothetical protein